MGGRGLLRFQGHHQELLQSIWGPAACFFFVTESRFKHKRKHSGLCFDAFNKSLFFPHSAFNRFPNSFGQERPVTRNFVQDSYTHVKTQIGVLCRTWTRKMKCLIWFKVGTGQQCNRVMEILQISLDSVLGFFFSSYSTETMQLVKPKIDTVGSWLVHATDLSDQSSFFNMIRQATFNTHAP